VKGSFAVVGALGRGAPPALLWALDASASIGLTFALFTILFRLLPEANVTWREALVSSVSSTALFALGSALVTFYVQRKHLDELYAGASALVVLVLWVYYSAQVFFFGACIGAALHERRLSAPSS
jgi:membrane protein